MVVDFHMSGLLVKASLCGREGEGGFTYISCALDYGAFKVLTIQFFYGNLQITCILELDETGRCISPIIRARRRIKEPYPFPSRSRPISE